MEAALVSVATGVLKPVLGKLAALLGDEYKRFKGVRKDIRFLMDELEAMHAFLLKMSEDEDPDVQDKVWAAAVRELSYDMEDTIDDFMQNVDDKDAKPDGFIEKIKHSLGKLGKMKTRHRIGSEIHDMKKLVIEVADRNARYRTGVTISNSKNAAVDPRALAIFEHASKLVGIDEPKAEIIKMLAERASTDEQPKLVSIVGSGGMGKTTLANQVYQELKEKFECKAFVSVSRNPDIMNILRTILAEVSQGCTNTEAGSIQQLISKINDCLANKRCFVVVDDIWDEDAWNVIKFAFPMSSSGSIIITTTRINDVAKSCCSSFNGAIYTIRPLNPMHSKELFHRRLFESKEQFPSLLEKVSYEILKKCDGLPLAIIAISGLLANKERTEDLWNQVKDSIGHALERNPTVKGMMKILSLSYFDLPPHLKSCLLYMSIFSEDSIIKRQCLIRRWIGEGFIHKEDRYTAQDVGERCFNDLLNRGLIQPAETNEYGQVKSCRVHDTILDFIISKSIEENFVTLLGVPILEIVTQNKVIRRLSMQGVMQGNPLVPTPEFQKKKVATTDLVLSHARSLNVFGDSMEIPSLEEFRHLRVLDLGYQPLEDHHLENVMKLFQLRYLNLRRTGISKLPEEIGRLGCLEMLNLRNNAMEELPASVVNLRKLTHLLVDFDVKFPDGIAKMEALETLKHVSIYKQPLDFLWGLGQLKNLRNLRLFGDIEFGTEVMEECDEAILSSLHKLATQNLRSLILSESYNMCLLQEPLSLEKLTECSLEVPQVPTWVSSLRNVQQLRLSVERVEQNDLCILGALPTLLILHLSEEEDSKEKLTVGGAVGFQFLRVFIYIASSHPVDLKFVAGFMPKLEKLVLRDLRVLEGDSLDFGIIKNLPCLSTIKWVVDGDNDIVEAANTAMERAACAHPNHPTLLFTVDKLPGDFCSGRIYRTSQKPGTRE
ncbi:hypothetical protein CFC21_090538 [Triticum aestivum]|uniref:AAA+ ATPase domain-containing protein n=2 Tax=Triticum aestivum TaxID=4565 RepID=A0A9R1LEE7_WHEAT|nr:disease resistance protein RGA5-like [Triticum aestivum]XP_044415742.1 disease resistance protein RGA5-like [Triticum aestivum]KAF7087338.1 hypothetical protein CFC21_090538 [Triticum aestivum]